MKGPIPDSYWVEPGRLLAGEYPGASVEADALPRLAAFAAAGVTSYVDLTEEGELTPYSSLLPDGVRYRRMAIRDFNHPTARDMAKMLDLVDDELARGEVVYVHCWGGIGRTGTVVGCWLVRHGLSGIEALRRVAELRVGIPDEWRCSPETLEQRRMVLRWGERR